jgi:hypothetical protein
MIHVNVYMRFVGLPVLCSGGGSLCICFVSFMCVSIFLRRFLYFVEGVWYESQVS